MFHIQTGLKNTWEQHSTNHFSQSRTHEISVVVLCRQIKVQEIDPITSYKILNEERLQVLMMRFTAAWAHFQSQFSDANFWCTKKLFC